MGKKANMSSSKKFIENLFFLIGFLTILNFSFANVPIVSAFGFGLPVITAIWTFGVSLVVVILVEILAIQLITKFTFRRSL